MHQFLTKHFKAAIILLSSMYLTGIILLSQSMTQRFALAFTPVHLLLTAAILLIYQTDWKAKQRFILLVLAGLFWIIEWVGVHTGFPFGPYDYGPVLGWQLAEIPLIIGINWVIYLYAINAMLQSLQLSSGMKIILGATILIMLDFLIEPVAIYYSFWYWNTENALPPVQNYLSWWILSALALIIFNIKFKTPNGMANIFLFWQFSFFGVLNLVISG